MDQSGDGGMPLRMEGKDIADWLSIDKDRFSFKEDLARPVLSQLRYYDLLSELESILARPSFFKKIVRESADIE